MTEFVYPNQSTTSVVINSRVFQRQNITSSIPKFLESFEEVTLKDQTKDTLNKQSIQNDINLNDTHYKLKDNNLLNNLQITQSFDATKNGGLLLRSSQQKKKIFEDNYLTASKLTGNNYQNYRRQRTFSTQIYDNMQTAENSFSQINQSLNCFNQNQQKLNSSSIQDEEDQTLLDKELQQKIINECISEFKENIIKEQSNTLDHLKFFLSSNEQKLNEIQQYQSSKTQSKIPQLTLSKLNQLTQLKNDIINKITVSVQNNLNERLNKIEDNQNTLYDYNKKIKQDLITYFNESITQNLDTAVTQNISKKIEQFTTNIESKILSIEQSQQEINSLQEIRINKIVEEIKQKDENLKVVKQQLNNFENTLENTLIKLDDKADTQMLQNQFVSTLNPQVEQIQTEISSQINYIKQEQITIDELLNKIQINSKHKLDQIENSIETKFIQLQQEKETIDQQIQDQGSVKTQQLQTNMLMIGDKINQIKLLNKKLQDFQLLYLESLKQKNQNNSNNNNKVDINNDNDITIQNNNNIKNDNNTLEMNNEIELIKLSDSSIDEEDQQQNQKQEEVKGKFITMSFEDDNNNDKKQIEQQTKEYNPYRKSSKLNDSFTENDFQESSSDANLFRYSTLRQSIQNDCSPNTSQIVPSKSSLQDIQNLIQKGVATATSTNLQSRPPIQQSKIVFRRKLTTSNDSKILNNSLNESIEIKPIQKNDLKNERSTQTKSITTQKECPSQEQYTFLNNSIPYKYVTSVQPSPQSSKENQFKLSETMINQYSSQKSQNINLQQSQTKLKTTTVSQQNNSPEKALSPSISLSQYYRLQMVRKSCDLTGFNYRNNIYSSLQENTIQNIKMYNQDSLKKLTAKDEYSSLKVHTMPCSYSPKNNNEQQQYLFSSKTHEKIIQSHTTDLKNEYLDININNVNLQQNNILKKRNRQIQKYHSKTPTLIGVDTPQEAKSDLKKKIIEQKIKKEGNKYLIPSINLNNLQISINE